MPETLVSLKRLHLAEAELLALSDRVYQALASARPVAGGMLCDPIHFRELADHYKLKQPYYIGVERGTLTESERHAPLLLLDDGPTSLAERFAAIEFPDAEPQQ